MNDDAVARMPTHWCDDCARKCQRGCAPCAMYITLSDAPEIEQPIGYVQKEETDGQTT